ncbi:MAG: KdsC family phosphatase [Caldimicrobium sp.]
MKSFPPDVLERAKKIKLLLLDVDGVLTDGGIIITGEGEEIKIFSVQDGMGIKLLQKAGVEVGILSGRHSPVVIYRAKELGIELIYQGELAKVPAFEKILKEKGLTPEEVAFAGDDWLDIPLLKRVGLSIGVPNAWPPVNNYVHYVTEREGGKGAVREICDLILTAKGLWETFLKEYL